MKQENIYEASEAELKSDVVIEWSGKRVLMITALPALFYSSVYFFRFQASLFFNTGWVIPSITAVIALICAVWTGCHLALVRGGNWLDCMGYVLIWCVIHAVAFIIFCIALMILIVVFEIAK